MRFPLNLGLGPSHFDLHDKLLAQQFLSILQCNHIQFLTDVH